MTLVSTSVTHATSTAVTVPQDASQSSVSSSLSLSLTVNSSFVSLWLFAACHTYATDPQHSRVIITVLLQGPDTHTHKHTRLTALCPGLPG